MTERLHECLAALVDGEPVDWGLLERQLGSGSEELARIRRLAEVIRAFSGAAPGAAPSPAAAGIAWGHLRVFERIGTGSYGEVHRAFDPLLEREVALKLRIDQAPLQARIFIDEARRLARVRHVNVLAVHGAAIHDSRAGLWSDLITGRSLSDWVAGDGPRPANEILAIARSLAAALAAVHAAGLVHGDVKPGNVMREEADGRIVLMDFGSAGDHAEAERHGLLGSPASMAPEQLRGAAVGPAADMYGLGVVLFHLASGGYPLAADAAQPDLQRLPPALRRLIADLLSASPAERPDPAEVERRVAWIFDAPRRRRRRMAIGTVIASLAIGLLLSIYALHRVDAERSAALVAGEREAATNEFLRNMLSSPAPKDEGADVRVVEVLATAAQDVRQRFATQPHLQVSILQTIGRSYKDLGRWQPAHDALRDALALGQVLHGTDTAENLEIESALRDVETHLLPFVQSRAAMTGTLQRVRRLLGDDHAITAYTALSLAQLLSEHPGGADEIRGLLELVLLHRRPDDPDAIHQRTTAMIYLAKQEAMVGRATEADALLAAAIDGASGLPPGWNPSHALIRGHLAEALRNRGDLPAAEVQYRAALDESERHYGPAHRNIRVMLTNLGGVLNEQAKFDEAVPVLARAAALGERFGGPGDMGLRVARNNLANALAETGMHDQARTLREDIHRDAVAESGPDHPFTLMTSVNLAEQYLLDGNGPGARALAMQTADRAARVLGPTHLFALEARELAARARFLDDTGAALREIATACHSKAEALGADSPHTASCDTHRADLLAQAGRMDEARALLTGVADRSAQRYGEAHPATAALRERLREWSAGSATR